MKYLLVPAGAVFIGMLPLPIDAYHLIRWIVGSICAFGAYEILQGKADYKSNGLILAIIALIYNPLIPFYLSRSLWLIIDVVVGGFLVWLSIGPKLASNDINGSDDLGIKIAEKMEKIEEKGDGLAKQTLISSIVLLVVIWLITLLMKK